jgi:hypothetical protein
MAYTPTGYPRGRPRKGELRPTSPAAVKLAEWRERNYDHWIEMNREYQREWRAKNPERSKEISRGTRIRKKKWEEEPKKSAFVRLAEKEYLYVG